MDTAANANWKGLRRNFDRNFDDVGVEEVWSQHVPTHTAGSYTTGYTATGTNALGATTVTTTGGALGTLLKGDIITFAGDTQPYVLTANGSTGSTVTSIAISPALKSAKSSNEAITLLAGGVVNLLAHPNAIAFAMAPMQAGAMIPGQSAQEATVVDNDSGLALRLTYFRGFYQNEWSFDALWGSAVPRPELGVRIYG